jgi:exonuclease SbcC
MKFKKVEIQAFRAYDNANDGTFDFTRKEDGENADFISLYAPNGFGKTSFYDAVEYGITKNIQRFIKKQKFNQETAKSEKSISSVPKQYILRNRYSDFNLESYIRLTTTDSTEPLTRKISIPAKGGRDFKFDDRETENKHFKEVILSQEWIDAFLKEDKPEDRYETFIEYFGEKKIDEYYKKLTSLVALNNKRIEALSKELNGIQLELKFDGDKNILKKVNEKIISLKETGEQLKEIDDSYTEMDALSLSNVISERTVEIDFEIKKATELIKYLNVFFAGNKDIEGMTKYFESKEKIEQLDKQLKENNLILEKFDRRQKLTNELESIKYQNDELGTKKQVLESLKNELKEYEKITQEISLIKLEHEETKEELSQLTTSLNVLIQNESENTSKQSSLQNQITELEKNISDIPKLNKDITNLNLKIKASKTKLIEAETQITGLVKENSLLEIPINNLKMSITKIGFGEYPSLADKTFSNYKDIIDELTKVEKKISKEDGKFSIINFEIQTNESYQKDIEVFISRGLEIINKSKTSSCPLCEQQYDSFDVLASKIYNNSLLTKILSSLLKERDDKYIVLTQLKEFRKSQREKLKNEITKQLEEKEKKRVTILGDIKIYNNSKAEIVAEIDLITKTLNDLVLKLNGKTIETFEEESKSILKKLESELESCIKQNEKFKKSILSESLKIENTKNKSARLLIELDKLSKEAIYLKVVDFFKVNYPEKIIEEKVLTEEIFLIINKLKANTDKELKTRNEIEELNQTLSTFSIENINKHNELIEKSKDLFVKIIHSFEQEVNSKLNIELKEYTLKSFSLLLNERKKINHDRIAKYELIIKNYALLSQFKDNVTPYLRYEKAKVREKDTKTRIKFLKTKISNELENELNRVSEYLTHQIDSFFYEGLINDLYRKIDPHPEYKTVTFKCDFTDTKPRLNVCVYQEKLDELIIPNLYFSTAQLNILSLSIFLAKALNAKDDKGNSIDCIFIDDPIQSMDSINILSTIDLIRSIVVNQKKQIILSTHDENFHNLLKKKMPPNLFNSKYMELETFGKVKKDFN